MFNSPDAWDDIISGVYPWRFEPPKVSTLPELAQIGAWVEWEGTVFLWVGQHWQKLWDLPKEREG